MFIPTVNGRLSVIVGECDLEHLGEYDRLNVSVMG
jgi:hypothetical protein